MPERAETPIERHAGVTANVLAARDLRQVPWTDVDCPRDPVQVRFRYCLLGKQIVDSSRFYARLLREIGRRQTVTETIESVAIDYPARLSWAQPLALHRHHASPPRGVPNPCN